MRFSPQLPSQFSDKNSKNSAKSAFMDGLKKGSTKAAPDMRERHRKLYQQKMDEVRNDAMKGAKYTFQLPGTDASDCQKLSKGAQDIIQKIAEKKAQRAAKRMEQEDVVTIRAKSFMGMQGGRIDSKGYIYDGSGQCILKVDKKTGKIKHPNGNCVGKYKVNCSYTEHRIGELIAKYDTSKRAGWYAGSSIYSSTGHGMHASSALESVWGDLGSGGGVWGDSSGGTIWGSSDSSGSSGGGNIWGNSSDDNKSGWW